MQFPLTDLDAKWSSREEAGAAFRELLPIGEPLPSPNHPWEGMSSDAAMSHLAFAGLGALRLRPVTERDPDAAAWVSDTAWKSSFEVRAGFERHGTIACLDARQEIVRFPANTPAVRSCPIPRWSPSGLGCAAPPPPWGLWS